MSHTITALIMPHDTYVRMHGLTTSLTRGAQAFVELPQHFWLLPFTDEVHDALRQRERKFPDDDVRAWYARRLSANRGKVAYVWTDYFGGVGEQGARAYIDKRPVTPPNYAENREYSINRALSIIGVTLTCGQDLFDSIGLGNYRNDEDWVAAARVADRPKTAPRVASPPSFATFSFGELIDHMAAVQDADEREAICDEFCARLRAATRISGVTTKAR
jgi:hypothetical protein